MWLVSYITFVDIVALVTSTQWSIWTFEKKNQCSEILLWKSSKTYPEMIN